MKYFFKSFNNYVSVLYGIAVNEFRSIKRNPIMIVTLFIYLTVFFVGIGLFGRYWRQRAIPSALPYVIFRYMNMVQAIIASVIASQFWADDYLLNTSSAVHTRSFSNSTYIFGKTLGIASIYLVINAALVFLILLVDIVLLSDVSNSFAVYGLYVFVIPLPTLIFATGISYLTMRFVKNQGIAISIVSGLFILLYFTASPDTGFLSDPTAYQIPLLYSDFVGFGNERMILFHRGLYVYLGLGLIALAAASFDRLRQSIPSMLVALLISVMCFFGVYRFGNAYLSEITSGRILRQSINELNQAHEKDLRISVTDCNLDLIHNVNEIEVSAKLAVTNKNDTSVTNYLFSLNPGLEIQSVTNANGYALAFSRELQLLSITPESALLPGDSDSLVIHYAGTIDEKACYPDLNEAERSRPNEYFRFIVDKRYAFVTPRYVLLTSEALWYPIPGVYDLAVSGDMSSREFTRYSLTVTTAPELTAVSQGAFETLSDTVFAFTPETPLTQISLVIGEYNSRTIDVDDVDVTLYLKPGHDFFSRHFIHLDKNEVEKFIEEMKQDLEIRLGLTYPFPRFSLVEVPVSFLAHQRFRPYAPATVQPEQVFLPEKTAFIFTEIENLIAWAPRMPEVSTPLDAEKSAVESFFQEFFEISITRSQLRQRNDIMQNKGLSWEKVRRKTYYRSNMYDFNIFPNYYWFCNAVYDDSLNEFDLFFGSFLRWKLSHNIYSPYREPWNIASVALRNKSFQDFLNDPVNADIGHEVIEVKTDEFAQMCMALTEIDEDTFDDFCTGFLDRNRFVKVDAGTFAEDYFEKFGVDIRKIYSQWITADKLPRYEVTDANIKTINTGRFARIYNIYATITNVSDVPGVLSAHASDQEKNSQDIKFFLESGQAKKIGFVSLFPFNGHYFSFKTFLSHNTYRVYPRPRINSKTEKGTPFEGVQIVEIPPSQHELGHIEIDNLDKGFSVLPAPPVKSLRSKILSIFPENQKREDTFISYKRTNPPDTWSLTRSSSFQGKESAFHYVRSGDGSQCVQWETNILRPGTYEVTFFFPGKNSVSPPVPGRRKWVVDEFHFTIHHEGGTTEKVLDIRQTQAGWASLGLYEFKQGPAKVVLSNKSEGKFVYADTVKFDIIE